MQGTGGGDSGSVHPKPRPACLCGKDFGRVQELNRHVREQHQPQRKCLFCEFKWARPEKIKAHILADHRNAFSTDDLKHVEILCGRRLLEFLKLDFDTEETLNHHGYPTLGYFPS